MLHKWVSLLSVWERTCFSKKKCFVWCVESSWTFFANQTGLGTLHIISIFLLWKVKEVCYVVRGVLRVVCVGVCVRVWCVCVCVCMYVCCKRDSEDQCLCLCVVNVCVCERERDRNTWHVAFANSQTRSIAEYKTSVHTHTHTHIHTHTHTHTYTYLRLIVIVCYRYHYRQIDSLRQNESYYYFIISQQNHSHVPTTDHHQTMSAEKKSPVEAKQPKSGDSLKPFKKKARKKRPSMFLSTRDQYIFNFNIGMVYVWF